MTDTPTPEAVERFSIMWGDLGQEDNGDWVRASDYDALLARVDALTKEIAEQGFDYNRKTNDMIERHAAQIEALTKGRDEALKAHIYHLLATYHLTQSHDEDGFAVPLVEAVGPDNDTTRKIGDREIMDMADMLANAITTPPPDLSAALAEHDRAVREDERKKISEMIRGFERDLNAKAPPSEFQRTFRDGGVAALDGLHKHILAREDTDHDHR
ncbi:hypothetical protein ACHFJ0_04765 [Paracoccus sp. NGMCC 1.201697]|uniref:Uncharacterized protein n=1 Tax=Paracoccus broussonetiae subsp. drimophilus TaxID=3373869 RepID=A0ABW7LHE1_9RHOB